MATENIFEIATRKQFTFNHRGSIGVYDLWDLKPLDLHNIYVDLEKAHKAASSEGGGLIVTRKSREAEVIEIKMQVVKHVYTVLTAEAERKAKKIERKQAAQNILAVIQQKEGEAIMAMDLADLKAKFADLNKEEEED